MISVHLLLGGITGPDGWVTSAGMLGLRDKLTALPGVSTLTYTWNDWQKAAHDVAAAEGGSKIVVIGYSGGGSRATWLANFHDAGVLADGMMIETMQPSIDLMVLYAPSPARQMQPIGQNVHKAINYHNTAPFMWVPFIGSLGGGVLVGPNVTTIDIAEQHLLVQADGYLHAHTIEAVQQLQAVA